MNDEENQRAMSLDMSVSGIQPGLNTQQYSGQGVNTKSRKDMPKHMQIINAVDGLDSVVITLSALVAEVMGTDYPQQEAGHTRSTSLTDMLNNSAEVIEKRTEEMLRTINELRIILLGTGG